MQELILPYNKRKILLYIIISFLLIILFCILLVYAEEITSKKPSGYLRGRWIRNLLYKKPNLFRSFCVLFNGIFLFFILLSFKKYTKGFARFHIEKSILFLDNTYLINIQNIKSFALRNKSDLHFYINDYEQHIQNIPTKINRIRAKIVGFFGRNEVTLSLSFYTFQAETNYRKIRKFIENNQLHS